MSIRDEMRRAIKARMLEGRLFRLNLTAPGDARWRTLLYSPAIAGALDGPWSDIETAARYARLRADLESFARGAPLTVAANSRKAKKAYMSHLDPKPYEVWDIRNRAKPGIRVLGSFSEADVFVALACYWRKPLGEYGSKEWGEAIECARTEWGKLFHPLAPHSGNGVNEYISENAYLI